MQQNQPPQEFGQDHIVRRLISKFRKPSDASAIGLPSSFASSGATGGLATEAGQTSDGGAGSSRDGQSTGGGQPVASVKQSRWSALAASAAAGAAGVRAGASSRVAAATGASGGSQSASGAPKSSLLSAASLHMGSSSSNVSFADVRDEENDENYFRPGGKGHQALLETMEKR